MANEVAYKKNGQWMSPAMFPLTASDLEMLKEKKIETIRMPVDAGRNEDFEIKEKHSDDIMKCVRIL